MRRLICLIIFCLFITSCNAIANNNEKIIVNEDIHLIYLGDSLFIHKTWHVVNDFRFSSNGLVIIRNGQALMIDTPMDNQKTEVLSNFIKDSISANISNILVTHFHDDCLGGLDYLHGMGVKSIAGSITKKKCIDLNLSIPQKSFVDTLNFDFNGEKIICRYFGAGHTVDNITVWLPESKILFGGCLVKSINAKGLGNTADAEIKDWSSTVEKVLNHYHDIKNVIPGHGPWGGRELLYHTIELVNSRKSFQPK
jgi:metallo-beta-lactamase class B